MSKKISVIVPVYNTSKYLERCVSSICNSTYSNLEIIIVNDGSTDISGVICEKLKEQDHRIKVIHKDNGGISDARNAGLDVAVGDYIAFVDSDDYIEPEMYEGMLSVMLKEQVSICVCMWDFISSEGRRVIDLTKVDKRLFGKHKAEDFASFLYRGSYENGIVVVAWNKLYERRVFESLRFEGRIQEDERICNDIFNMKIDIFVVDNLYYNYVQNHASLTNQAFNKNNLAFLDILVDRFKKIKSIQPETLKLYANMCMEFYFKCVEENIGFPPQHIVQLQKLYRYILFQGEFSLKLKIRAGIFLTSPILYERMILRDR